jgi:putative peptidoglycan lipid II flippase
MPDLIMSALFRRGAFDVAAAERAGAVLAAYAIGLPAALLINSARASFYARADTTTPLIASLTAVAANVALKLGLMAPLGVVGLALATAIGAWINLGLLFGLAYRRDWTAPGGTLAKVLAAVTGASVLLAGVAVWGRPPLTQAVQGFIAGREVILLATLGLCGAAVYGLSMLAALKLLGVRLARS